jgi:hypothetical protein
MIWICASGWVIGRKQGEENKFQEMVIGRGVIVGGFLKEIPFHFAFRMGRPTVVSSEIRIESGKSNGFPDFANVVVLMGDGPNVEITAARWEERGQSMGGLIFKHVFFRKFVRANVESRNNW